MQQFLSSVRTKLTRRLRRTLPAAALSALAAASAAHAALVIETEPNPSWATASPLSPGDTCLGNIAPIGDIDWHVSTGHLTGVLVFAYLDTQDSNTSTDSILWLINNSLAVQTFDDNDGPGSGSAIAGVSLGEDGNVYLAAGESSGAAQVTPYVLYHAIVNSADGMDESEPNDSPAQAQPVAAPMISGNVSGVDVDLYAVEALAGQTIVAIVDDNPDGDATLTDTELHIVDIDGVTILANGDDTAAGNANAAGAVTAAADGTYYVRVAHGGTASALDTEYRLVVLVDGEAADPAPAVLPCAADADGDGVCDDVDLCDGNDAFGDTDGDGICDDIDNCPSTSNAAQTDTDGDGTGDACEAADAGCGLGAIPLLPMMLVGAGCVRKRARRMR